MERDTLSFFMAGDTLSASEVYKAISQKHDTSLVTIKRLLSKLTEAGGLLKTGGGRSIKYSISNKGRLYYDIDPSLYCKDDVKKRISLESFNFSLFESIPESIFAESHIHILDSTTKEYHLRNTDVSDTLHKKELERFIIELSWKSSQIEGNTYTLLDTEKLIKDGIEAVGKTKDEAIMILNHKKAFDFIYGQRQLFVEISVSKIEAIHKILVGGLGITHNIRSKPVGILGSRYRPLDNMFQIQEALDTLCQIISRMKDGYSKALMIILGISYIQPFEDGNKRTSRLVGNAILLAHNLAPLSYRIVDEEEYREAILVFYELNSLMPFRDIFFDQYIYSSKNYLI